MGFISPLYLYITINFFIKTNVFFSYLSFTESIFVLTNFRNDSLRKLVNTKISQKEN
jgi:hypothetical protein